MARSLSDLTARKLIREHAAAVAAGERNGTTKFSWGKGLVLAVSPTGSASWDRSRAGAERQAPRHRPRQIRRGLDRGCSRFHRRAPASCSRGQGSQGRQGRQRAAARNPVPTFQEAASMVHAERAPGFRNSKHRGQWINSLRDHAFKPLESLGLDQVDVPTVTRTLKPAWGESIVSVQRPGSRAGRHDDPRSHAPWPHR